MAADTPKYSLFTLLDFHVAIKQEVAEVTATQNLFIQSLFYSPLFRLAVATWLFSSDFFSSTAATLNGDSTVSLSEQVGFKDRVVSCSSKET